MSLFVPAFTFTLRDDTLAALQTASQAEEKTGGPQDLIRLLLRRVTDPEGTLTLEEDELLKVRRYGWKYGTGTYERAFRRVIGDARAAGWQEPAREDSHTSRPGHRGRRWDGL
jgi:hypothetical protein